jgi:hypothetical protein
MKLQAGFVVAFVLCCAATAFGQQAQIPLPPPATDTIAPDIPGVVKGRNQGSGHRRWVAANRWAGRDGDGTLLYWDLMERRIGKVAPDGKPRHF